MQQMAVLTCNAVCRSASEEKTGTPTRGGGGGEAELVQCTLQASSFGSENFLRRGKFFSFCMQSVTWFSAVMFELQGCWFFQIFVIFFKLPLHACQFNNLEFVYGIHGDWDMLSRNETQYNVYFLKFKYFVSCTLFAPTNVTQCILKKSENPTQAQSFILAGAGNSFVRISREEFVVY
jgi:hypothetical protein